MRLLLLLSLLLCGCTIIPTQHGKAQFWGDYSQLKFDDGTVHFEAARATHSPAIRAQWQGASNLAAQAVAGAIGLKGGNEVVGGIATVIPPIVNRPTNRQATP
jgi:hypothetical protein